MSVGTRSGPLFFSLHWRNQNFLLEPGQTSRFSTSRFFPPPLWKRAVHQRRSRLLIRWLSSQLSQTRTQPQDQVIHISIALIWNSSQTLLQVYGSFLLAVAAATRPLGRRPSLPNAPKLNAAVCFRASEPLDTRIQSSRAEKDSFLPF